VVVHVRQGIDLGAGVQEDLGDFDGAGRRLLSPAFDAVGGDVVQQRRVVPARRAGAD